MKPQGLKSRTNSRSSAVRVGPEMPVMKARRLLMRPISSPLARGSRKRPSIPLDPALAAGGLQAAAELVGFLGRAKGADHGAVAHTLLARIGPLDHRLARSQHRRILALQRLVGRLGGGLVQLR